MSEPPGELKKWNGSPDSRTSLKISWIPHVDVEAGMPSVAGPVSHLVLATEEDGKQWEYIVTFYCHV